MAIPTYSLFWEAKDGSDHGRFELGKTFNEAKEDADHMNVTYPHRRYWVSDSSFEFEDGKKHNFYPVNSVD